MADPIPDGALRLVERCFDAATVRAGVAHVDAERVHVVKPPPWPVVARVRGDAGYVVTVHFTPGSNHLRGECSCPVAVDCEHAAAAALVVLAGEGAYAEARALAARQAVVGEWLAELGRAEPAPAGEPASDREVAYVIDAREGDLGLTVLQCTRLRSGALNPGSLIGALGDPHRGAPRWVEVDDLQRIALLRAVTRAPPQTTRLPLDRIHGELLRELAGCGRLFWQTAASPPLSYGPPIVDALRWQASPGGADGFRLGLDAGLVIVPARDGHYLDVARALIGPLELGVPAGLVQRLVAGPPVPRAMRATVERSLRPLLAPAAPAAALAEAPDEPEALRPHLHVSLEPDTSGRPAVRLAGEARYGDQRFVLAEWDPRRPFARDLVAEGRHHARLARLITGLPHGGRTLNTVEVLADARHAALRIVPTLRAEGWTCLVADDFPAEAPLVELGWVEGLRALPDSPDWFAIELGVAVAGRTIPLLPVLLQAIRDGQLALGADGEAVAGSGGLNLRLPEGELVHVPAERVQRWLRPLIELELRGLDPRGRLVVPAVIAASIDDEAPGRFAAPAELAAARDRLTGLLALAPRREGASFAGELRTYQRVGHAWLRVLHDAGCGGLLADEMGLGKTVQVLAFLDGLRAARRLGPAAPALVVAPRSVVGNWQREATRFAPKLRSIVHLGAERAVAATELTRAPLILTSYQTLVRDRALFQEVGWTTLVLDEAQAVKNPDTQLRTAVASLRATSRFCITGTPIENHLGDLWSQVDLAMPGLLGRRRGFEAVFRRPIEKHGDRPLLETVRQRVRPFLLRRTKDAVELELPAKTEVVERVELEQPQRDLYESLRLTLDARVQRALAARGLHGASMAILDALLKLRQCCCDPRLVKLPEARRLDGSAKLERLLEMLQELADSGRRVLVFSQFASMLALIGAACAQVGLGALTLTGATRDRDDVIRRFQAGEAPVFLVSLKAGGVGLNLTRADTVIHYDPWWNPAAEAQATDRAHRIGQEHPVMVYKLVAEGTLEEAILQMQDDKRQLGDAVLREGGASRLVAEDLAALYRRIV